LLCPAVLQSLSAPSLAYVRDLATRVRVKCSSTTVIGSGMGWWTTVEPYNASGIAKERWTMLSARSANAADAFFHCLGEVNRALATMRRA